VGILVALAIVILLAVTGGSIAGSYLLTIHYVHEFSTHQAQEQLKAAVQSCKALRALDDSHNGINFPKINSSHPSELALTRMFKGIHDVYISSHCQAILSGHYRPPQ